jgi:heme O synthase-like polyprenyltransferase
MTIVGHTVMGAVAHWTILTALSFYWPKLRRFLVVALVSGAVAGAAPDLVDWVAWALFGTDRWEIYNQMHSGVWVWLSVIPAYGLHLLVDIPFHPWVEGTWRMEVAMWAGTIFFGILTYIWWRADNGEHSQ